MNKQILTDSTFLYYALKVHGKIITPPLFDLALIENYRRNLPPEQQALAEVVTVDRSGTELLLG
jgi:hypothetical protein